MDILNIDPYIYWWRQGLLFGYCLNILLYGILTVQVYLYYLAFPKDRNITKAVVTFVYIIDTAQTILALHDFYTSFCVVYKNDDIFLDTFQPRFIWLTIPLSSALIAVVAQCFYAHRIYILSKKKVIAGIVITLALAHLLGGVSVALSIHGSLPNEDLLLAPLSSIDWGGTGVLCDLIIAVYMTWFLKLQMRHSPRRTTQVMLTKIKRLVLETGLMTVSFAIAFPLLMYNLPDMYAEAIPGLTLGKIYSNSILVLLNNRFVIQGGRNEPTLEFEIDSYHLSDVPRRETR